MRGKPECIIADWLGYAKNDLDTAQKLLQVGGWPAATAFHAQQSAEKGIKALLIRYGVQPSKTHDIASLLRYCETEVGIAIEELKGAITLTPYAVEIRYPGRWPEVSQEEATTAVAIAEEVLDKITKMLTG